MFEYKADQPTSADGPTDFRVKVLGVGGAGANIIDRLADETKELERLVSLNTDLRALSRGKAGTKIQLGKNSVHGLGCGGDPELGRAAAQEAEAEIRAAVTGADMVFVCAGLGGGTGSGATPEVVRIAKEEGCFVIASITIPFHFEGRRRSDQAQTALAQIRDVAGAVLTFENDRMGELIVPKDGVQQAFEAADKTITQSIRAITSLVEQPGMISVGMDDILAVLSGKDARCLFGFGQATGKNRAQSAVLEALSNPLLESGDLLGQTSTVLIHISGDESVKFAEVQEIMERINEMVGDAQILFGVSTNPDLVDTVCVAIISSLDHAKPKAATPEEPLHAPAVEPELPAVAIVEPEPAPTPAPASVPVATPAPQQPEPYVPASQEPAPEKPNPVPVQLPDPKPIPSPVKLPPVQMPGAVAESPAPAPIPEPKQPEPPQQQSEPRQPEVTPMPAMGTALPSIPIETPAPVEEPPAQEETVPIVALQAPSPTKPKAPEVTPLQPSAVVPPPAAAPTPQPPPENRQLINPDYLREGDGEGDEPASTETVPIAQPVPAATPAPPAGPTIFTIVEEPGSLPKLTPVEQPAPAEPAQPKVKIEFTDENADPSNQGTPTITLPQPTPSVAGGAQPEIAAVDRRKVVDMDPHARGRFAKTEPTIYAGEDLDVPTYLRRKKS